MYISVVYFEETRYTLFTLEKLFSTKLQNIFICQF